MRKEGSHSCQVRKGSIHCPKGQLYDSTHWLMDYVQGASSSSLLSRDPTCSYMHTYTSGQSYGKSYREVVIGRQMVSLENVGY